MTDAQQMGRLAQPTPAITVATHPTLPSHMFLSRAQGKEAYVTKYNLETGRCIEKLQYRFPLKKSDLDDPAMAK